MEGDLGISDVELYCGEAALLEEGVIEEKGLSRTVQYLQLNLDIFGS